MELHPKAPDRRVQRTRETLLEALGELLMECGYERITIQNIIDRAGVGRATFYAHFESKDDLLACSLSRLRDLLRVPRGTGARERFAFTRPFFEHLLSHRRIYLMTVCREDEITVERLVRQMLTDFVRAEVTTRHVPTPGEALAIQYVVGALWSTLVWWMDHGQALSPAEVNTRFQQLTFPGLDAMER
jgi:AcrR family transcriptional regulator